jgi:hypothetical protein
MQPTEIGHTLTHNNTTASSVVSRAALLADPLTDAIDYFAHNPTDPAAISTLCAELVGRCASQAASAVLPVYRRVEQLEAQVRDLTAQLEQACHGD